VFSEQTDTTRLHRKMKTNVDGLVFATKTLIASLSTTEMLHKNNYSSRSHNEGGMDTYVQEHPVAPIALMLRDSSRGLE
jgi:hypothetical protein